ncbi:MAG: hypothetical protein ABI818_01985 [Acidobacteriota bacterium]
MIAVWIISASVIAVVAWAIVRSWQRRVRYGDLGVVSHQWVAEQRLGRGDSQR